MKCIRSRKLKPNWLTKEVTIAIKGKKAAFHAFKASASDEERAQLKISYDRANRIAKKTIRKAKRVTEIKFADDCHGDVKKFFSFYKFNKQRGSGVGPLKVNGTLLYDDGDMVSAFSRQFSSVFTIEDDMGDLPGRTDGDLQLLWEIEVTKREVRDCLLHLATNKAAGPDEICSRILREAGRELAEPLHLIFERSLHFGEVPDDWKSAHVVPIFKKGSKSDVENYRPVSLTSQVCKIL